MLKGAAAITLMVFGMVAASPATALVAADATTGTVFVCEPLASGERFGLAYTHSMYGGEVREEYVATGDGRLRRLAMTTANAAAAEYYAHTADVVRDGERFRVDLPAAEFAALVVRVDRIGAPRLVHGDGGVDLVAIAGDDARVRLELRTVGLVHLLPGRSC
jgi:hypothetical protein